MAQDVSITLPSAIIYVIGTVNGESVTFSLTDTNTWTAACEVSDNGVYVITIQAFDAAGNSSEYNITLYYGLQLITDRTVGTYEAIDLNRVGAAMVYVRDRLVEYGYSAVIYPKCDFAIQDDLTPEQATQYLSDLDVLRDSVTIFSTTPETPPDMDDLSVDEANNIEKILRDLDTLITNMVTAFVYSGEVYSGEVY